MDFSNFNSAEQAHMTKVIEKRQVWRSFNACFYSEYDLDARFSAHVL
jgi:hypothetical protein